MTLPVRRPTTTVLVGGVPVGSTHPIVVHCRSGMRSATAAGLLRKAGGTTVHDIGGLPPW